MQHQKIGADDDCHAGQYQEMTGIERAQRSRAKRNPQDDAPEDNGQRIDRAERQRCQGDRGEENECCDMVERGLPRTGPLVGTDVTCDDRLPRYLIQIRRPPMAVMITKRETELS